MRAKETPHLKETLWTHYYLHNYKGYKYAMVVDYLDWNDIYLILTDDDKQKESFLKSKRFEEEN